MSALRTMTCPTCGRRHLIGAPCSPAVPAGETPLHLRIVLSLVAIALTAAGLTAISFAAVDAWGVGKGVALIVCIWIMMQLLRLGFEYDDGIDFKQLLLPSPFDWGVKVERLIHFWTSRMLFRSAYLGTSIALVIVVIRFAAKH